MNHSFDTIAAIETLEELVKETAATAEQPKFDNLQDYIGTAYKVAGLRSAQISDIYKDMAFPATFSVEEKMHFWEEVWFNNEWFELMSMALLFIRKYGRKLPPDFLLERLIVWEDRIDNWAHSDELAHALASLLPVLRNKVLQQLQAWNNDANPWKRRQSLVATIRIRKNIGTCMDWNDMHGLILPLKEDPEYYVQKGVGWALCDAGTVYPDELNAFLAEHCVVLPSPAFATAVEKIPPAQKEGFKAMRKSRRKKG